MWILSKLEESMTHCVIPISAISKVQVVYTTILELAVGLLMYSCESPTLLTTSFVSNRHNSDNKQ